MNYPSLFRDLAGLMAFWTSLQISWSGRIHALCVTSVSKRLLFYNSILLFYSLTGAHTKPHSKN